MAHTQMLAQFFFKVEHFSHRNVVKISMVCGEQRNGQFPHLQRLILRLLQQLGQPLAAFIAGRMPALNKSVSRKIWPSVIEITFVGTKAVTSPACVSITGSAVRQPLLPITAPFVT